jgi:hypothetical protein
MDPLPAAADAPSRVEATGPRVRRRSRVVEWTIFFTISFNILSLLKLGPIAHSSVKDQNEINNSPQRQRQQHGGAIVDVSTVISCFTTHRLKLIIP